MNLKFIGVGFLASVAAVSLAACSSGGSTPGVTTPQQSASTARGTLTFVLPKTKKVAGLTGARRPAYVATGFTHGELFIDGVAGGTLSSPFTPGTYTITFSTTPGQHTFALETDDGTNILAEGSAPYTLVAGDNTAQFQANPLTLNGVAYGWFLDATTSGTGEIAIYDADGNVMLSSAGNYDNGPLTITSNPAGATFTLDSGSSLSVINSNGTIDFTDSCTTATTIGLVVNEAAVYTPSIALNLTGLLVYGPPSPPALVGGVYGLPNSLACP